MIRADAPLETVPMFVRAGAIIIKGPAMNYVNEKPRDPLTFEIYPDDTDEARGILYEDDGNSPAYKQGVSRKTTITATRAGLRYDARLTVEGNYDPGKRRILANLKGAESRRVNIVEPR